VDRSEHLPAEGSESMTLTSDMADYVIDNNSDLFNLGFHCRRVYNIIESKLHNDDIDNVAVLGYD
jgi:hypothetical protein